MLRLHLIYTRVLSVLSLVFPVIILSACSNIPVTQHVNKSASRPAFGTPEFNQLKDAHPDAPPDVSTVPDAIPVDEPLSRYGNKSPYTVLGKTYRVLPSAKGFTQTGKASWYGTKFHGLRTSSGESYDMYKMTAAHRSLPLPTYVRVTNLDNNKSVIVKVNDRGPFHSDRVMDLSYSAAFKLDILKKGTGRVRIEAIDTSSPATTATEPSPALTNTSNSANTTARNNLGSEKLFIVQLGAFGNLSNAKALLNKARPVNDVTFEMISTGGLHRVQAGPFSTKEDAEAFAAALKDQPLPPPVILTAP